MLASCGQGWKQHVRLGGLLGRVRVATGSGSLCGDTPMVRYFQLEEPRSRPASRTLNNPSQRRRRREAWKLRHRVGKRLDKSPMAVGMLLGGSEHGGRGHAHDGGGQEQHRVLRAREGENGVPHVVSRGQLVCRMPPVWACNTVLTSHVSRSQGPVSNSGLGAHVACGGLTTSCRRWCQCQHNKTRPVCLLHCRTAARLPRPRDSHNIHVCSHSCARRLS